MHFSVSICAPFLLHCSIHRKKPCFGLCSALRSLKTIWFWVFWHQQEYVQISGSSICLKIDLRPAISSDLFGTSSRAGSLLNCSVFTVAISTSLETWWASTFPSSTLPLWLATLLKNHALGREHFCGFSFWPNRFDMRLRTLSSLKQLDLPCLISRLEEPLAFWETELRSLFLLSGIVSRL